MRENETPNATPRFDGRKCTFPNGVHWLRNGDHHAAVMRGIAALGLDTVTATGLDFADAVGAGPFDCFGCVCEWAYGVFPPEPAPAPLCSAPAGLPILCRKKAERVRFCYPRAERRPIEATYCSPCGASACLVTGTRREFAMALRDKRPGHRSMTQGDIIPAVAISVAEYVRDYAAKSYVPPFVTRNLSPNSDAFRRGWEADSRPLLREVRA